MPGGARVDADWCSKKCRQAAFRLRRRRATEQRADRRMRFVYADPPYPGLARKFYGGEESYAGEVDHVALIAGLEARRATGEIDGWALSTAARSLRSLLPLCPEEHRVCAWVKPIGGSPRTRGVHNRWEALIVVGGRQRQDANVLDWLRAQPARGGGELPGRKPLAFVAWLFDCLGMVAGDQIEDLFPGTGIVGRAWAALCRGEPSPLQEGDASLVDDADASPVDDADASPEVLDDGHEGESAAC
jgi:hypothetical protein